MMKTNITIKELKKIEEALAYFLNMDIPILTAWKFSKIIKPIKEEFKNFDDHRKKLVQKYGILNTEKQMYEVVKENNEKNYEEFTKQFEELMEHNVEIEYEKISINELGDIKIPTRVLCDLEAFISN